DWVSPWVRACALRALDTSFEAAAEVLARAAAENDPLVAATAAAVLEASRAPGLAAPSGRVASSTVDKVLLLRDVSLFSAIPHEELVPVASLLTDRWASRGERVVERGEVGDCLYIVVSGRIRVHDDERTLAQAGPKQFFGELSLLDAETRSASVT